MRISIATSLICAALISNTAFAQDSGENEAAADGKPAHHGKHGKHGMRMGPEGHRGEMALKKIDTNGDGQVDIEEFMNHSRERFEAMDQNGDNLVTPEEAREHHKEMRQKHREAMKEARKAYRESKNKPAE